ncbi:uncharacterized protein L969DRAFT_94807 [Mixia osmundae IAM 14324]|uniref:RING-type domain-containing protein n=1 Tax=Mixia osmundae (strain CBS 9802 / IAM 14324 / JCM 22182 / KY 12970) TaxID=764103 RepID=G7E4A9_MIXOS|nr:uncharacterized protein L969DRAFT_94807 [Mixia osmundae IAM 14324]KEI39766.1 hypothetical protein L969DRAFT_94807 [Mixia osmundae IAM 14324]GAA97669.1 hypothetical protein E5Q_04347 [Mixia osmundae IAM 14324]
MMKRLPDKTVSQLRASALILTPLQVIESLIQNAAEAGATHIRLSISHDRSSDVPFATVPRSLTVSDDGPGIASDDLERIISQPHHTSDPTSTKNGVFLHSLATVGRLQITSRGHTRTIQFGQDVRTLASPAQVHTNGTSVCVDRLFDNLPVRQRSLASLTLTLDRLPHRLKAWSIAQPQIGWQARQIIHCLDGSKKEKVIFSLASSPGRTPLQVFGLLHEASYAQHCGNFSIRESAFQLSGFYSLRLSTSRQLQYIDLNGVPSAETEFYDKAVESLCHVPSLHVHSPKRARANKTADATRYAVFAFSLRCKADEAASQAALLEHALRLHLEYSGFISRATPQTADQSVCSPSPLTKRPAPMLSPHARDSQPRRSPAFRRAQSDASPAGTGPRPQWLQALPLAVSPSSAELPMRSLASVSQKSFSLPPAARVQVIAQVDYRLLLCALSDSSVSKTLVVIDQHGLDERVRYENLLEQLAPPLMTISLDRPLQILYDSHPTQAAMQRLRRWGFECTASGSTVQIRTLPELLAQRLYPPQTDTPTIGGYALQQASPVTDASLFETGSRAEKSDAREEHVAAAAMASKDYFEALLELQGYEYLAPVDDNLICPICRQAWVEPLMTPECEHVFCARCLHNALEPAINASPAGEEDGVAQAAARCPTCRLAIPAAPTGRSSPAAYRSKHLPPRQPSRHLARLREQFAIRPAPRFITQMLEEQLVRCLYRAQACPWTGERQRLLDHLTSSEQDGCLLAREDCGRADCTEVLDRASTVDALHRHVEGCGWRLTSCSGCQASLRCNELQSHSQTCPARGETCPHCERAADATADRSDDIVRSPPQTLDKTALIEHISICPHVVVPCPHARYGCEHIGARSSLTTEHLLIECPFEPLKAFLSVFQANIDRLSTENAQLRGRLHDVEAGHRQLRARSDEVRSSLAGFYVPRTGATTVADGAFPFPTTALDVTPPIGAAGTQYATAGSRSVAPLQSTIRDMHATLNEVTRGLEALELKQDMSIANETIHIQEELQSLRGAVHTVRMQQHYLMMERREAMLGSTLANPSTSPDMLNEANMALRQEDLGAGMAARYRYGASTLSMGGYPLQPPGLYSPRPRFSPPDTKL